MRPIRPVVVGGVKLYQGTPIGKSLILMLKCGHVEIVPQHPKVLRKLVRCPMCIRLWTEREEERRASEKKDRARNKKVTQQRQQIEEMTDMAKKTKKQATKSEDRRGRKLIEYVKAPKADLEKKHVLRIVHDAAKKVKSGTVADITEMAVKLGLAKATGQDPLQQTGVMLNRLAAMGSVKKIGSSTAKPKAGKKSGKKFVLKTKK